WLHGEVLEQEIDWWRQQLAGLPPLLELPTDRPRPAVQSYRGATRPVRLPAELTRQMEALARHEGATLFMVLLAGFQTLLARISGQDGLAVGSPVAGRNRVETEGLIGFFVNTLVLRGNLAGEPTFRELLGQVRETALAGWLHQDVPFEKLVEELAPARSLAHAPLFQAVLVLQNAPVPSLEVETLRLRPVSLEGTTAKFDLTVNLSEHDGGLLGTVEHATDLWDATTIDRLLAGFERLLAAAVAGPDLRAEELPLLDAAERQQLLEWGGRREEFAGSSTLHGRFAAQARRTPDAPALTCGDVTLSYGELDRRSNQLAHWLRRQGAGPESRVGLCLDRSVDLVVGILGVLKTGAAYVPIDPEAPRERRDFVVEDAGIQILVEAGDLESVPDGDVKPWGDVSSLAFVIYTSGSTGRPKGTLITHGNVTRLFDATEAWFGFRERDVWTLFHSYTFDFSVWEIWGALLYGGRLVVVPWEVSRSPEPFLKLLVRERVTVLNQTPSAFAQLAQADAERGGVETDLRLVIFGGEALDPASLEPWFERHGDTQPRLVNMYGITETTVHVTYRPLSLADARGEHRSVIGVPIADLSLAVLDRSLLPAPIGVPGELVIGGAGLARGYLGRPELTAERFIPEPSGGRPGARLYRSGDLGRFLPDGDVEYLGRLDHQVKIRGFRIELGEIEAALAALPGVRQAVVVVRSDGSDRSDRSVQSPGDRRLIAYVIGDATAAELRQSLRERLPDYMVPAAFVVLDDFPLTINGKVDRQALPAPEHTWGGEELLAPRTPVEEILAGIWAELLGVRVGVDSHFFDLGGHSLLATQVMSRLREAFGVEMPLRDLFVAPRLAELAARVETARRAGAQQPTPPLVPVSREGVLPLSFAQQRLWFIDQLEPGSPLYTVPVALRVEGPLDAAVLACCLGEIVRRHEALRTVFAAPQGAPVQVIQPAEPFLLPVVDLSALPEREELVRSLTMAETGRPFDLARGPMLRGLLVRLAERDHAVVLTLHHIASDGWSMGLLIREVAALYPALAAGQPSPLPELPVQYADFAAWQRSRLDGEALEREIDFWRGQLAGLPPLLELPTDHPRPAMLSHRGAARPVRLSAGLIRQIQALGRQEGATLFMVLLAGFQTLLARLSGQDDLAVGSPVAGRNRVETEGLIGFFVNTLVLRGRLTGAATFRELLGGARETALAAWLHQDVPFERLVEELAPERSLAHAPLFQVVLVLQNAPLASLEIESLRLRPLSLEGATSKFDLTVALEERDGGLVGRVEHATDLWDATTIDRLLASFERLLAAAVAAPDLRAVELPLLSEAERQQLLEWGGIREEVAPLSMVSTLHGRFVERARSTPEAPALTCGDVTLTYGELHWRSNQLARWLRRHGAGPESRVGLRLDRSVDLVVGILGVLKAGAAYVPLDPGAPRERMAFVLEDADIRIVVGPEEIERLEGVPYGDLEPRGDAPGLAYVIYTSGSTGRPKGTLVTHANVTRLFDATEGWFGFGERDVWTLFHSYAFDFSVWEIWGALLYGGRLVVVPWEVSRSPEQLLGLLVQEGVTVLNQTPSAFAQLAQADAGRGGVRTDLRFVIFGGEALDPASLEPWFARHGDAQPRLVNMYGITETTVHVTYRPLSVADARGEHRSVIGVPIADLSLAVLDRSLNPAPIGVPGELVVGGAGLARGYLGRPELTAERFAPDPAGGRPGARLYRSGDLGRFLPNGDVEYLGRLDNQVKIRGFRIELGEIEAALSALPGVRQAVVLAREDRPGDRRLAAYVVGSAVVEDLRGALREQLPEHMVPAAFVVLDDFPLTVNGKVDRKALPVPEQTVGEEAYMAPRTPAEEVLAGLWAEVLGLERVGAADDFFDLGGHSLLATQVMSRLREAFGVEIPLHDLFEAPVLADLAARVEAAQRTGAVPPAPPLLPVPRERRLPLSFAQQRLWFIDRVQPGSPLYNVPAALRVEGPLDAAVLARCLGEIVRRHEALRTVFIASQGTPVQVVQPPAPVALPVVDLSALAPYRRQTQALALAGEEAARPFDLGRGPLVRCLLVRLAERDHAVVLTLHHIASDGWSMGILVREIATLYPALSENTAGRPSPLPELPVQYVDFSVWQRSWLRGEVLEHEIAFWRGQLAGLPPLLELPTDRPRPAVLSYRGATRPLHLPPGLVRQAEALGRREGATLFMVLLAAFQALLARLSGQDDLAVGSPVAGRNRVETEGLIGFFVNTLVLRGNLTDGPTMRELLGRTRGTALAAWLHQDLPFEKLVEELAPERSLAHTPLFQVMLALQNAPLGELDLPGLRLQPVKVAGTTAKVDLTLSFAERDGGALAGTIEYATALFDAATVDRLGAQLSRLLAAAAADPDVRVAELPLLSAGELHQLLAEWNDTGEEGWEGPVTSLVERWCREQPEAPAVVDAAGRTLTYGELGERAGRLAGFLQRQGVGPESVVAVLMERSPELLVAQLGILQAGAAYLSLDPAHPTERLAFMLDESVAPVVLTQESLERDREEIARCAPLRAVEVAPDQLAYVIYTSGSTGRPKGVQVPHRGLLNLVRWDLRAHGTGPGDHRTQVASLGFDASVWEIWSCLASGATLHLPSDEARLDPQRLAAWMAGRGVTVSFLPTPLAEALLAGGVPQIPSLRRLLVGGDRLSLRPEPGCGFSLINHYGPAEASVVTSAALSSSLTLGRPIDGLRVHLLDRSLQPVPPGVAGELWVGGPSLARGYLADPGRTAERFLPDPWGVGERLYRTGDLCRYRRDGEIEFLGRMDHQVKIRGQRIELGEIEAALLEVPGVREAVVALQGGQLVAYVVGGAAVDELRRSLRERLPAAMVPSAFATLAALPLTSNGKVDRKALPAPAPVSRDVPPEEVRSALEDAVAGIWCEVLGVPRVGAEENFFDLGGHSLLLTRVQVLLTDRLGREVSLLDLLTHTTVRALARHLEPGLAVVAEEPPSRAAAPGSGAIAIVGLTGRFPGAPGVEALWANLRAGVSSTARFSDEELAASGVAAELRRDPRYVPAAGVLDGVELFDAGFFGYNPREAELLDPQQRLFLECAWEALEDAGYDSLRVPGPVGVFASLGFSRYLHQILTSVDPAAASGLQLLLGNDKDFLATRVSYKLDLAGPSMTVQTACSSSLVAVHLACQNLRLGACDMALAGGVSINLPQRAGYLYEEGGIASPDGCCRAFDAAARGTVGGSGAGIVVLKRLEDALAHGDTIHAVLLGSAVNNDGASGKAGYTAPSVAGQAKVISAALADAGVSPESIAYVEAHGT
ncbi:MAG TPA: amino acid adenylation domain-containing protein, partial [Thermoanaerobaculia bacterium]|nr:amino acid adenylation domain-containing protein [Thermoanaerobaculia bacterium]